MELSILLVFIMNVLFQISTSSSDSLMWSLIHSLQIIRYICMVNVKVPKIFDVFIRYLAVTIGEVDQIYVFIPNWFGEYVVGDEMRYETRIEQRFKDNGRWEK